MIFVNVAGNVAPLASRKRNNTCQEVGSSSKRATLELFPTLLNQTEQSPAPHINGHSDFNEQSLPREDLFVRLFKSQVRLHTHTYISQYILLKYGIFLE